MIRWKYLLPRLVLLGLVWLVIWLALNPSLRLAAIHGGQSLIGARVDIGTLQASLVRARLRLRDVAVADPESPMQNLFQADSATFDVDTNQLLRRRLVMRQGRLSGVRLGTPRSESGALPNTDATTGESAGQPVAELGRRWLDRASQELQRQALEDLESVRLALELAERWPQEYAELEGQVQQLQGRSRQLVQLIEQTRENPLRSVEHYQRLLSQLQAVRLESDRLRHDIGRLQEQMARDREAVAQARQHDVEYARQRWQLAQLDPDALAKYLLGPEVGPRVRRLLQWLPRGAEESADGSRRGLSSDGGERGWTLQLPGMRPAPDLLIHSLVIDGGGACEAGPYGFHGTLADVTTQPALHGRPMTLTVQTAGAVSLRMEVVLDRTGPTARDRVVIDAPQVPQPARVLGQADQLAIHVSAAIASWNLRLQRVGQDLCGQIHVTQPAVTLRSTLSPDLGGNVVAERIDEVTRRIERLEATIDVAGTVAKPSWEIHLPLARNLSNGLRQVLGAELRQRQEQLVQQAGGQLEQQLEQLEAELKLQGGQMLRRLGLGQEELEALQQELAALGLPGRLLGDGSAWRELLRR
jgi:uncharacterized protein (TIGR03545 family)